MLSNLITIAPPDRRTASVEVRLDFPDPVDRDVGWKIRVDAQQPLTRLAMRPCIEVHDLLCSVDTGIGAAGADDREWMISDFSYGLGQQLLDAATVSLRLPADEIRSVILEAESDTHNRRRSDKPTDH